METKEIELPPSWKRLGQTPYINGVFNVKALYAIAFFFQKRAVLFNRQYMRLTTMETRNAKKLIDEARKLNWIEDELLNSNLGQESYPDDYPKRAQKIVWINIK